MSSVVNRVKIHHNREEPGDSIFVNGNVICDISTKCLSSGLRETAEKECERVLHSKGTEDTMETRSSKST